MIRSLVVPVDETADSERVLPVAAAVADRVGAPIELLTVDSTGADRHEMERYQARIAGRHLVGLPWRGSIELTDVGVAETIVANADRRPGSLLCMATDARGAVGELVLGSVGDRVVELLDSTALLVGPDVRTDPSSLRSWLGGPVVVLLEGNVEDGPLAARAAAWARHLDRPVVLAHVLRSPGEAGSAAARARAELDSVAQVAVAEGLDVKTVLVDDADVGRAALRLHRELGGGLVVGTHRRRPLGRLAHGSDALWIVRRATCPVLVSPGGDRASMT
jgi:nucleotide-binding universal stress UspA family protein